MSENKQIILENGVFRLVLGTDGRAQSLYLKSGGTECLAEGVSIPFFAVKEERAYNNEIKLAHPVMPMTFGSNRLRMEDGRLIVGFELIDFEAVVEVKVAPAYMVFTLVDFVVRPDSFGLGVVPMLPPVSAFRMAQLPLAPREHFGSWLNVLWDDRAAVNVLAAAPYSRIASEEHRDHRILYGEALREVRLKDSGVALVVSEGREALLDSLDAMERELGLPLGVQSRRSEHINHSYYWSAELTPGNLDEHIKYAKMGGFRYMLIYYTSMLKEEGAFLTVGDYHAFRPEYPRGLADLRDMLERIKAAGIIPGLHILHTHIGLHTPYLTPKADHRLNLTRRFTLAEPLSATDTEITVEEDPAGCPEFEKSRVIRIMGELIRYSSYTNERPYRFLGCERGYNGTAAGVYEAGSSLGILDISEFCANSAYIDQRTGLQDEIAEQIAEIYNQGFEFIYFDGSEGVNEPFDINVGLAQWRVYKRLNKAPLFCEGAAKSNFSWHMLSGGNAFDVFAPDVFKEMIAAHPFAEAPRMADDLTRLNFGWWSHAQGQRADIMEYGTALAAAWECPGSFSSSLERLNADPRTADILAALKAWEDARCDGFITPAVKEELRHSEREHTLIVNESGERELAVWEQIEGVAGADGRVTAFLICGRKDQTAVLWHNEGEGRLAVELKGKVDYLSSLDGEAIAVERAGDRILLPIAGKRYLVTELTKEELVAALKSAELLK